MKDNDTTLADLVCQLATYYVNTEGQAPSPPLHRRLLDLVEMGMLEILLKHCRYNQSRIAHILGISRNTCRLLLTKYFGQRYVRSRIKNAIPDKTF